MSYPPLARTDLPAPFVLQDGDVHVWQHCLEVSAETLAAAWNLLSAEERDRAARYRFDRDRRRFVAARALLRTLLGGYTDRPPASVVFREGPHGKPMLEPASNLEFNVSHSHEIAVYAVARQRVGVDIEYVRVMPDALGIARRFFSAREIEALERIELSRSTECFFTCWTRKEAYLKGRGEGIGRLLDSFSVSLDRERPGFIEAHGSPDWTLTNLDVPAGYIAALAIEGPMRSVTERTWIE